MPKQLTLQFEFKSNQRFGSFYSGNNQEVVNHLQQIFNLHELFVFLWGGTGTGKTHLMQATIHTAKNFNKSIFYISLNSNSLPNVSVLHGLEDIDLVCLDNIEQISGNNEWEREFFNFYNLHRDNGKQLFLSASCPPQALKICIPDLQTRMSWGLTLKLQDLSEEQILNALIFKANALGFEIKIKVGRFLLNHYARDLPSIWLLLDKIKYATLTEKRKLTIPFLKKIMLS